MATAMAACAGLGLKTAYLGSAGNDHNGRLIISELTGRGVDVSHVLTRECPNRFAVITVDETTGERIVLWDRDDRLNLSRAELDAAAPENPVLFATGPDASLNSRALQLSGIDRNFKVAIEQHFGEHELLIDGQ